MFFIYRNNKPAILLEAYCCKSKISTRYREILLYVLVNNWLYYFSIDNIDGVVQVPKSYFVRNVLNRETDLVDDVEKLKSFVWELNNCKNFWNL